MRLAVVDLYPGQRKAVLLGQPSDPLGKQSFRLVAECLFQHGFQQGLYLFYQCITFVAGMEKNIQDKDLGVITLRTTPRATRYTLKISKGKITATMPPGGDEKRMIAFIMENKPKLIKALQKHPARPLIDEQTQLQATTFRTHIFRTERENFYMRLEEGILHIACPLETCFEREEVQSLLKSM